MKRVAYEIGAVVNRLDANSRRKAGRVQIVHRLLDPLQYLARILSAPHQDDTLYPSFSFADSKNPRLRRSPQFDTSKVPDENRHAFGLADDDTLDVVCRP